jgi:hypothetical protein
MSQQRVLVVVDEVVARADDLAPEVESEMTGASELYVVAPALNSRLRSLVSDVDDARHRADDRLHRVVDFLRSEGCQAEPQVAVGDEDPLQAIDDALAEFPADTLVVALHAQEAENWREHHLAERLKDRLELPTTVVLVDSAGATRRHAQA